MKMIKSALVIIVFVLVIFFIGMMLCDLSSKYIIFCGNEVYEFNIVKDLNIPKSHHSEQPVYIHTKSACDFAPYIIFKSDINWIKKHIPDYNKTDQRYSFSRLKKTIKL